MPGWKKKYQTLMAALLSVDLETLRSAEDSRTQIPIEAEPILLHFRDLFDLALLRESERRALRYQTLQAQINPHFLYNALESIRGKAITSGSREISDMTEALGRYFRYLIGNRENLVTLESEFDNIRTYFQIQQFRFGERYRLEIDPAAESVDVSQCILPKLTLQPIVENAIMHGLEEKGEGTIRIHAAIENAWLRIRVRDDGVGMTTEQLAALNAKLSDPIQPSVEFENTQDRHGVGMRNVCQRLRLTFGEGIDMHMFSVESVGATCEISIPVFTRTDIQDISSLPLVRRTAN